MHHKEEGRGRHKNPVFQHFFSPQVGQRNHLSPEYISVTSAKTRNGHWWQIYSSRFLTFVSCPEQGQLHTALCSTRSWERDGAERKPGTVFLGRAQCCFAVSYHIMGICNSAKAETLRREKIRTIALAKAAGGACLESVSKTGRKGLPRVYTNAARPLRGGKAGGIRSAAGREVTMATALSTSVLLVSPNVARRDKPLQMRQLAPRAGATAAQRGVLTVTQKPPRSQPLWLLQCLLKTLTGIDKAQPRSETQRVGFPSAICFTQPF